MDQTSTTQTVTVTLVGGPADWRGRELEMPRGDVYGCPREDVGAYLVTAHPPERGEGHDPDPRADYSPALDESSPRTVWQFWGWVP
ncbi:hypothetical protein [Actinomadura atramentaria]|uniref:hypothetical protein n=1 Tax=Actinomadura atramentaria TaxID=1990 RepID=UPI000360C66D|nr:hypothetical protein [Actinomadura atramentaria]